MGRFIFRRILGLIPTMFLIITLSFFLIRLAPGGPFSSEKKVTPEVMQNLLKKKQIHQKIRKQKTIKIKIKKKKSLYKKIQHNKNT